jgi:hypothetical protein
VADRYSVGVDTDDAGAALYFFIHPLQQVGAPDLFTGAAVGSDGRPERLLWPRS